MTMVSENANEAWCYVLNKLEIKNNLNIYTFWLAFMYIRSRSKQTKTVKTQDFFVTESLIYDKMGDMWALISSKRHAYRSQSHTHYRKAHHSLTKKLELVLCVLFLKSSKCVGDSTIELVFNPCGGEGSRERGVITVH